MIAKMLVYFTQAYLSLPEGAATAAGLIAMMTDHYSNLVTFYSFSFSYVLVILLYGKEVNKMC
jgi:hypothetical protein